MIVPMDASALSVNDDRVRAGLLDVEKRDDQVILTDKRFDPNTGEPTDPVVTTMSQAEVAILVDTLRERNDNLQATIDENNARITFLEGLL